MITPRQVADLRPGDVVELARNGWPDGTVVRGPLYTVGGWLYVAEHSVKSLNGSGTSLGASYSLTVISRAPRPLYVNHDRTEPVEGDVFQSEYSQWPLWIAGKERIAEHKAAESCRWIGRDDLPDRLRLLVDGETGRCVP